ncbi:hypothetical protein M662_19110 [Bacillus sp. SB49]|uniref:hypothetical protein n=1 Tax=Bacillus sp. SB49 TaxID=1071080 RepID=UPI0004299BD9|nr:hypothetical protein [Bacillus sp. SB49]QHT48505.1 hypothetical protein M662_19110 [Bacillus sp. SB49]
MHYTERLLVHKLVKKHNISFEMVQKLLKESKKSSYENQKDSKKIAEIENLITFYVKKEEKSD